MALTLHLHNSAPDSPAMHPVQGPALRPGGRRVGSAREANGEAMGRRGRVVVLGIFVADAAYRASRLPRMGETVLGSGFALGPGGKGSNQAVAAARAGAQATMLTRLGCDAFAAMARDVWADAGVEDAAIEDVESYTGSAFIFLDTASGDNAIIVAPGAAARICPQDVALWQPRIEAAAVVLTQLEQPVPAAHAALAAAKLAGATTILNPAPAAELPPETLALCDYVTPNESEAETLTGIAVDGPEAAERAARALLARGAGAAAITLGGQGVLYCDGGRVTHLPAMAAGPVVDTTGAGDAFNGGFAAALARGEGIDNALQVGIATAGIAVTRPGAAAAMPTASEVAAFRAGRRP